MATKKFPNTPQHPERVCWGCDEFCSAHDMRCGNGSDRTPHPVATVLAVCTGEVVPFARGSRSSGIHKTPRQGRVRVTALGLDGDAQGDLRVHGGLEKAVHHYQ